MFSKISLASILVFFIFGIIQGQAISQTKPFYLLDNWSVDFAEDVEWKRWEARREADPERYHMNEPPGWSTWDIIWTERSGHDKFMGGGPFPCKMGDDWRVEWKVDMEPFSLGQGCGSELQYGWDPDPEGGFPEGGYQSVDFCLAYYHMYISGLQTEYAWLCGIEDRTDPMSYYADASGWKGIITMRMSKIGRELIWEAKKEGDAEFTVLRRVNCAISTVPGFFAWNLSTNGEYGVHEAIGQPWTAKAQYVHWYTNAERPKYSVYFAEQDSLDPFILVPGTESPDMYSFTENPGYLRIYTEYATEGILTAKNQLIQPFSPNLTSDFYVKLCVNIEPEEVGQAVGIKLLLFTDSGTKEVVCYWGKASESIVGFPGGDFFAAGLAGEEVLTDAESIRGLIFIQLARVGGDLFIGYSNSNINMGNYRRLATLHGMEGGLLNVMLAAGNFGKWGATPSTGSVPVDIPSIEIEEETVDLTSYTMDNEFNNGLAPFSIPAGQENSSYYSLVSRPGWLRIQTQYHDGDLSEAKNALVQEFTEPIGSGISVEARVDMQPTAVGQIFGMQLGCHSIDGVFRNVIVRFGQAATGVTGGGFTRFLEYGYEGESVFVDASSIGSVIRLRIERFADRFLFSYTDESEEGYTSLGEIKEGMGMISEVMLAAANLSEYGATSSTPSLDVDVDYFRYLDNMISGGQCEFAGGKISSPWTLMNVDSSLFSLTERDGWLKVKTGFNSDMTGRAYNGPNVLRNVMGPPYPGVEGDFDFTCMMEGRFSEAGQVLIISMAPADGESFVIQYGMIGGASSGCVIRAGVNPVLTEIPVTDVGTMLQFRIIRQDSTVKFEYTDIGSGSIVRIAEVDSAVGTGPVRYVTVAANNMLTYGATEATSSVPVYYDYIRFNRIDDYLADVDILNVLPEGFALSQNYPNPFNSATAIRYRLPLRADVKLEIFNILGQRVRTLVDMKQRPGSYTVYWDGCDHSGLQVASGVYIYRFMAGEFKKMRRMTLLR